MKTKLIVEITIAGDPSDAYQVLNKVLDSGVLQDAINDYESDGAKLRVTSIMARVLRSGR